jgi:hypothetical protein
LDYFSLPQGIHKGEYHQERTDEPQVPAYPCYLEAMQQVVDDDHGKDHQEIQQGKRKDFFEEQGCAHNHLFLNQSPGNRSIAGRSGVLSSLHTPENKVG